ncbi:hypothetical protein DFH08DRAFT_824977 [Mycena albidolilacea]|uniref:Uncharacterized protein n=1 Tax=Mycena albidolilacea TaxID=1033008 RepID=A0AAD7EAL9_9AGAR|nr:hypothetical protein DFH08DRAFT_824977 [Mycena albidolilacea]
MPRTPAPAESSSAGTRISGHEWGNPTAQKNAGPSKKRKHRPKKSSYNSDPDDSDFTSSNDDSADETQDSDVEMEITNAEVAESLPSKTIPDHSKRNGKGKGMTSGHSKPGNQTREHGTSLRCVVIPTMAQLLSKTRRNAIHHFFEEVNDDGTTPEPETRYYKCYLGRHKILKITKKMNNSITVHNRLHQVLNGRSKPPTLVVVKARLRWARTAIIELLGDEWSRN